MSFACCSDRDINFYDKDIKDLKLINEKGYSSLTTSSPYVLDILSKDYKIITEKKPVTEIERGFNYAR